MFTFTRSKVMVFRLSVVETKCQSRTRRTQWQPLGHLQLQGDDFLSCVYVYAAFSRQTHLEDVRWVARLTTIGCHAATFSRQTQLTDVCPELNRAS